MVTTDTKLQVGSVILVHGWVMMDKLNDGCRYRVVAITPHYGKLTYTFKRVGGKTRFRHYAQSVDLWIKDNDPDLNKIEIVDTP